MNSFFSVLAAAMLLCLLMIVGMVEAGTVGLGLGALMLCVNCGALIGCLYLAGAFEEVKE